MVTRTSTRTSDSNDAAPAHGTVGSRLRRIRRDLNLSLKTLAELAEDRIRRDERRPR